MIIIPVYYFQSKVFAASSLWCTYSKLKTILRVREKVDVSSFTNVVSFLKKMSVRHVPRKSNVLSRSQIDEFLLNAPDDVFLLIKVVTAFGVFGACRRQELHDLCFNDVKVEGSVLVVRIAQTKNYKPRTFTIVPDGVVNCVALYEKYVALRPKNVKCKNLFIYYKGGKCSGQQVGINSFGKFPMEIAKFLKLPNPSLYTVHCFRRSSATILSNSGATLTEVKRLGGWKSSSVAESYIEECIESKIRIAKKITVGKADENIVEVGASSSSGLVISNVQNCTFNIYSAK